MAGLDLGKQMGPLPLGAWIAVVAGGLGIAWYTTRTKEPINVDDTSGTPGVGVGAPADWTPINGTGGDKPPPVTTNEQWAQKAIGWLIAQGYPPVISDSAVRKYITGAKLSVQETTLIGIVLVGIGPPPQTLPPGEEDPPPNPNPDPPPNPTNLPPFGTYVSVPIGEDLYGWVDGLNRGYPGLNTSFTTLFGHFKNDPTALNPRARSYMEWLGSGTKTPVFRRSGGVPPMRIR